MISIMNNFGSVLFTIFNFKRKSPHNILRQDSIKLLPIKNNEALKIFINHSWRIYEDLIP